MRILRFLVNGQSIEQDPSCDFSGLFPGRNPDVRAKFVFSSEWKNSVKVAAFWSMLGVEYEPQVLVDDSCTIPVEALSRASFKIQVIGRKEMSASNLTTLSTNKLTVRQTGGKR